MARNEHTIEHPTQVATTFVLFLFSFLSELQVDVAKAEGYQSSVCH